MLVVCRAMIGRNHDYAYYLSIVILPRNGVMVTFINTITLIFHLYSLMYFLPLSLIVSPSHTHFLILFFYLFFLSFTLFSSLSLTHSLPLALFHKLFLSTSFILYIFNSLSFSYKSFIILLFLTLYKHLPFFLIYFVLLSSISDSHTHLTRSIFLSVFHSLTSSQVHAHMKSYK